MTDLNLYTFPLCTQARSWLPRWLSGKEAPAGAEDARDSGLIPGSERFPRGGNGSPLQCSCLENPRDRGAWWLQSTGSQRVRHNRACMHTHIPVVDNWVTMKDAWASSGVQSLRGKWLPRKHYISQHLDRTSSYQGDMCRSDFVSCRLRQFRHTLDSHIISLPGHQLNGKNSGHLVEMEGSRTLNSHMESVPASLYWELRNYFYCKFLFYCKSTEKNQF